jgi:dTDP-4-dehydrorhamnose 3,5-epimerase
VSFQFQQLNIPDVILIKPALHQDDRGVFAEVFKSSEFTEHGMSSLISQVNHSISQKHVLRGLHYQLNPKAQSKLISVVAGEVFDVAVDIRTGSPHYGRWVSRKLTAEQKDMLWVPAGFAHGFCVLSAMAEVIYFCTEEYAPEYERGIIWNDPAIGIVWPIPKPVLSDKDQHYPTLEVAENNFSL